MKELKKIDQASKFKSIILETMAKKWDPLKDNKNASPIAINFDFELPNVTKANLKSVEA